MKKSLIFLACSCLSALVKLSASNFLDRRREEHAAERALWAHPRLHRTRDHQQPANHEADEAEDGVRDAGRHLPAEHHPQTDAAGK